MSISISDSGDLASKLRAGVFQLAPLLSSREWAKECVIYDGASGDTHILRGLALAVFTQFVQRGSTRFDAVEVQLEHLHHLGNLDSGESLKEVLAQLEASGLIVRREDV